MFGVPFLCVSLSYGTKLVLWDKLHYRSAFSDNEKTIGG